MFKNENGFTLIELVVVIILVGILSYVTLMNITDSSSSIKEKTLATKIVTDIRYAQEMALSHQRDVKCIIEPAKNCYSLKWGDDTYLKTTMGGQNFIVDFDAGDFSRDQLLEIPWRIETQDIGVCITKHQNYPQC